MRIDPHVHCRDGRQSYKETIEHVFRLCDQNGIDVIFDMPNTDPPILRTEDVENRLALVPKNDLLRYRVFLGATPDENQLKEAVSLAKECKHVAGIKMYAGQSVGPGFAAQASPRREGSAEASHMGITAENDQRKIYEALAALGYHGVLAVHCEKESMCKTEFDPQKPITHCRSRPVQAETRAIEDQIRFTRASGFRGILHVCHVSTAESVASIRSVRAEIRITCGVTPHHLLWSNTQMNNRDGLLYKVNPPLREMNDCIALRQALKAGEIDWIETDHAPHPISEKLYPPYASGFPSICLYGDLVDNILPLWGFDKNMIKNVTCDNIKNMFMERNL